MSYMELTEHYGKKICLPVRRLNMSRANSHFAFLFDMFENLPSETSIKTSSSAFLLESIQLATFVASSAIELLRECLG